MRAAPRAELIWASPRELLNVVQADADRLPHHHLHAATCWPSSDSLGKDLEQFSLETVQMFHRDAVDRRLHAVTVQRALDHRRRRVHRLATSPTGCSPTASRSSSTTTSAPAGASSSPTRWQRRDARRGRRARHGRARRPRSRAATRSSTCRPTPTCATASSTRARPRAEHDRAPRTCSRRCAPPARRRSRSPRPARSTASPRSSRRPRTRRSRSRPRSTRASKLAGEGLIGAYCHGFGFTGVVFRFVSILGERYTHGHVIDFFRALQARPDAAARARRRPPAQELPLRAATASSAILDRAGRARGRARHARSTTSAPTSRSSSTTRSA